MNHLGCQSARSRRTGGCSSSGRIVDELHQLRESLLVSRLLRLLCPEKLPSGALGESQLVDAICVDGGGDSFQLYIAWEKLQVHAHVSS